MHKVTIYTITLLFFLMLAQHVYAQNPDISVEAEYGMETHGGNLVMKGGKWVPEGKITVSGGITLFVKLDGNVAKFSTKIIGTEEKNGKVAYQCANGESFYLDGQTAHPIKTSKFKEGNERLEKLVAEFRKNQTDILAWSIWKHVNE